MSERFDLMVIGGGPAGYLAAERASREGMRVILFERRALGGVCLNEGCIPSKALLNSAKLYEHALHSAQYGVHCGEVRLDQQAVTVRRGRVVRTLVNGVKAKLRAAGVTVVMQEAKLDGRDGDCLRVTAGGEVYLGKRLLIASGSTAIVPPIPGVRENLGGFVLTNREVLELTDRIYVFRDAENAGEFETAKCNEMLLYESMVGKSSTNEYYSLDRQRHPDDEVVLEARNLHLTGQFKDVSFKLRRGEILGFCGVVGSGKEELCYVLSGDEKPTGGTLIVKGSVKRYQSPAQALRDGITMIPQERNAEGVFGILSITDNIAASSMSRLGRHGFISGRKMTGQAKQWISKLRIRTPGHKTSVSSLSGGNAQKVVFAKMLSSESDIVLLNHPTRGVDIGAKVEIYSLIRDMAESGKSIILLGDTLDECISLSNRVLIMKDGLITGEFDAPVGAKPDHTQILQRMM